QLHDKDRRNIVSQFRGAVLDALETNAFFRVQQIFCDFLPLIDDTVENVAASVRALVSKAQGDLAGSRPNVAFLQWCRQTADRAREGIDLVEARPTDDLGVTSFILQAGFDHDPKAYVAKAIGMTKNEHQHIRYAAMTALGRMALNGAKTLETQTLDTLEDIIRTNRSPVETAIALDATLSLLKANPGVVSKKATQLLKLASGHASPNLRYICSQALFFNRQELEDEAINVVLDILSKTPREETGAIENIDVALSNWDLSGDRERIFGFIRALMSGREQAVDIVALDSFLHSMRSGPAPRAAWFVASLLLTGDHRLCTAASVIAQNEEAHGEFDLDLTAFGLNDAWLLYFAQKAAGYLTLHPRVLLGMLVSACRAAGVQTADMIADIIFDPLLLNYGSIEANLARLAAVSDARIKRVLRRVLRRYKSNRDDLKRVGVVAEFRPTDRELHLEWEHQKDFWREVNKAAEQQSVFMSIMPKSILLYGSHAVIYVYRDAASPPVRTEMELKGQSMSFEMPALSTLMPVGLSYRTFLFRNATRPE
ncbi:MAG: hypothetical protein AB7O98_09750, partial [Hyphomonadaceae bacterium]